MTTMTHDANVATVALDEVADLLRGKMINTRDALTFQGRTPSELEAPLIEAIAG